MSETELAPFIHPSALVEDGALIGAGAKIWHDAQIRRGAQIGERCSVGKGAYVDTDVIIGADSKLQNYACIYHGTVLGRGVFVGPHVVFANDKHPRATALDFRQLRDGDWQVGRIVVEDGASFGAHSTILPGVRIGQWSMVAAGAVVTRDVAPLTLVAGIPARRISLVCKCGTVLGEGQRECPSCGAKL